jgi:hypothetical protein
VEVPKNLRPFVFANLHQVFCHIEVVLGLVLNLTQKLPTGHYVKLPVTWTQTLNHHNEIPPVGATTHFQTTLGHFIGRQMEKPT